jgi:hypothetical protein
MRWFPVLGLGLRAATESDLHLLAGVPRLTPIDKRSAELEAVQVGHRRLPGEKAPSCATFSTAAGS